MAKHVTVGTRKFRWRSGRVEMWRGGLGRCLYSLLARPFVCECHNISTVLRFHIPLIEPGVRFSRTGLSDKDSRVRTRKVSRTHLELNQPQGVVDVTQGKACGSPSRHLMLPTQPPA